MLRVLCVGSLGTWEPEVRGLRVRGQSGLHGLSVCLSLNIRMKKLYTICQRGPQQEQWLRFLL